MKNSKDDSYALLIESAEDKLLLLEQYKILLDTLEKANDLRETVNKFWISVNGAIIATIAYIIDSEKMGHAQKPFFLTTILFFGFILTASWFSTLFSIKNNIDARSEMLGEFEKHFPAKIFSADVKSSEKDNWDAITLKEMFVPFAFLAGYIFFGAILYFLPHFLMPSLR